MAKKELSLEDLEPQYAAFCENVKAVKQNTYWRTAFHETTLKNIQSEKETRTIKEN